MSWYWWLGIGMVLGTASGIFVFGLVSMAMDHGAVQEQERSG